MDAILGLIMLLLAGALFWTLARALSSGQVPFVQTLLAPHKIFDFLRRDERPVAFFVVFALYGLTGTLLVLLALRSFWGG